MEDWPLQAYLWANTLPDDKKEHVQILRHTKKYWANRNEVLVFFPK